ncbi:MAG TPA: hypothetical protein VK735_17830 [Pseudonocardia sp.]|jgi:hypothetical protein|uniref:hypothetical protein n=1 Tax=Pseudonocardia sp. TaxID=60912 RepID=UPI002C39C8D9|nr:hypothetical protein [Pseudonocardia sp.]HTF49305.1 hypothetical protein [Pseudonocardia sp.]
MGTVDGPYLLVLFIGAVIVVIDGQLIFRNSPAYLNEVYQNASRARQVSGMVAVLFHLVMLGLVALIASIGWDGYPTPQGMVARVGVLLLLTAVGHAATMGILSRMREQQLSTEIAESQIAVSRRQDVPDEPPAEESDRPYEPARGEVNGLPPEDPASDPTMRTPRAAGSRGRWTARRAR